MASQAAALNAPVAGAVVSRPIAKQLVSRAIPVSLNVPAAMGPALPSPAEPTLLSGATSPAGLAAIAAASAAVVLYRRRVLTTEIPESIRSTDADASIGDPWA